MAPTPANPPADESRPRAEPTSPLPRSPRSVTLEKGTLLYRIFRPSTPPSGRPAIAALTLRRWGPHPQGRFDPHPEGPPAEHAGYGIWYGSFDLPTALAEAFGNEGLVDTTLPRTLACLEVVRPLRLLDLTGTAPTQFWQAPHPRKSGPALPLDHRINTSTDYSWTQRWARAFNAAYPDLPGVLYPSRFTQALNVALTEAAFAPAPPLKVLDTRPLSSSDPKHRHALRAACERAHLAFAPRDF